MKKIIRIASTAFSGSTMLDLMLAGGPNGFSAGEVSALFRPFRPHHLAPECGCGDPECKLWGRLRAYGERRVYDAIFSSRRELEFIVDSSKDLVWFMDQDRYLRSQPFQVVNILLWKTPLEYAYACWKRGKEAGWRKRWKDYYSHAFAVLPTWHAVRYKDLAQNSATTLTNLCNAIGVEYRAGKELFWQQRHHTLFGSDSVKAHFLDVGTPEFAAFSAQRARKKPNVLDAEVHELKNHRKIYYDDTFEQKLPHVFRDETRSDAEVGLILDVLEATDSNSRPDWTRVRCSVEELSPSPRWSYWKHKLLTKARGAFVRIGMESAQKK